MSKMSELHAEFKRVDDLLGQLEDQVLDVTRGAREGDYWVALMNIAYHPVHQEHPLSAIAKEVLEKHNGTA
jgi:hypothetical protein